MFVKEFFFSFSLLAFTGILMVLGGVLLIDAMRRLVLETYRNIRKPVPKKSEEKGPTLEQAA